jgi:hypothetical protein
MSSAMLSMGRAGRGSQPGAIQTDDIAGRPVGRDGRSTGQDAAGYYAFRITKGEELVCSGTMAVEAAGTKDKAHFKGEQ